MTIGDRIKIIRGSLSQKEFTQKIDPKKKASSEWESGKAMPGAKSLEAIHRVFGVDINWLLTGEGEPYINKDRNVVGVHQVAEHAADYAGGHGSDPFADAVSGLKEIFDSRDPILIPALEANIRAFRISARREKQLNNQAAEIKALHSECDDLKKRLATLEEKYKLIAPQPLPDEAAA